jgi:hypothetical protein
MEWARRRERETLMPFGPQSAFRPFASALRARQAPLAAAVGFVALAASAWPAEANPFFQRETGRPCAGCHLPGREEDGRSGLNRWGWSFLRCGYRPCDGSGSGGRGGRGQADDDDRPRVDRAKCARLTAAFERAVDNEMPSATIRSLRVQARIACQGVRG